MDIIESRPRDEVLDRAIEFARKLRPNSGFSNLYVARRIDRNGNVIDEKYGMNLMTDYGMKQFFTLEQNFPTSFYVGNGTTTFTVETNVMAGKIPGLTQAAINSDTNKYYGYPTYFASADSLSGDTGLITCVMKYLSCYYDYNISGLSNPVSITEYGIGGSSDGDIDKLWTHSWVYDSKGKKTYITKNVNERLVFDVYLCMSYYESLILSGYQNQDEITKKWTNKDYTKDDSRFTVITTMHQFMNRMLENEMGTFKRNNVRYNRGRAAKSYSAFANNRIYNVDTMNTFTMYAEDSSNSGAVNYSGYIDGFYQMHTGFLTLERQHIDPPENIDITVRSQQAWEFDGISRQFGSNYNVPVTQLDATSVCMFDHKSTETDKDKRWGVPVAYHNDKNHWYTETSMTTTFAVPIYYTNNDTISTLYLYQNMRPDDPIEKIDIATSTIYATNRYWNARFISDTSVDDPDNYWILITDPSNIPEKCKTARYWITNTKDVSMTIYRRSDVFYLRSNTSAYEGNEIQTINEFPKVIGSEKICDNYEYGWYMRGNKVYIPDRHSMMTVGSSTGTDTDTMTYRKWLVTFNSNSSADLYYADMSNVKTAANPTVNTFKVPFTDTSVNIMNQCYRTESDTGLICLQSIKSGCNEAVIIDLRNDTWVTDPKKISDSRIATCIWGTNKIAYIKSTPEETPCIHVFDMETESEEVITVSYDGEEGLTDISTISFMYGSRNKIWITDGSKYAYAIDITSTDKKAKGFDNAILISYGNLYKYKITIVDDVFIIYNPTSTDIGTAMYICYDNPTHVFSFDNTGIDYNPTNNMSTPTTMTLRYLNRDGVNNRGALMLLINRGDSSSSYDMHCQLYDFGQYLFDETVTRYNTSQRNMSTLSPYGEYMVLNCKTISPAVNLMPVRIKGTTNTITTLNHIKNVSNKQFTIEYTNLPQFGNSENNGLPPGVRN